MTMTLFKHGKVLANLKFAMEAIPQEDELEYE
jgi:hypothetical protein